MDALSLLTALLVTCFAIGISFFSFALYALYLYARYGSIERHYWSDKS